MDYWCTFSDYLIFSDWDNTVYDDVWCRVQYKVNHPCPEWDSGKGPWVSLSDTRVFPGPSDAHTAVWSGDNLTRCKACNNWLRRRQPPRTAKDSLTVFGKLSKIKRIVTNAFNYIFMFSALGSDCNPGQQTWQSMSRTLDLFNNLSVNF